MWQIAGSATNPSSSQARGRRAKKKPRPLGESLFGEQALTLEQAAAECIGNCGKPCHPETVRRWMKKGVNGVKLEHKRQGRRYLIFRSALRRFIDRLSLQDDAGVDDDGYLEARKALRERQE